jgi:hypothetical protein
MTDGLMPGLSSFGEMYPSPKSIHVSEHPSKKNVRRTYVEGQGKLQSANELRVEAGGDLDSHTAAE